MDDTCVRQNHEKPEAGLYPESGDTRNQIVVACTRSIRAMHMTRDEANQAITKCQGIRCSTYNLITILISK
jgi:hypothetical protein